jgi:uncharacterized protein DUF4384
MLASLLLPLFIGGPAPAARSGDDPAIRLWLNNDRNFLPGDRARVEVQTKDDGYLLVFHVDPEGHLRVLFPLDPDQDNFIRGGKKYEIQGRGGRESFEVDTKTGKGTVYAAVAREPLHFEGYVLGDHWDYRALAPSRLPEDPESDLNELVRRTAQTDFDYDLINYYVSDRVASQSDYGHSYSGYSSPWCYGWSCGAYYGSSFHVSLVFGAPYRLYYYDPYYYAYNPFDNPFYYSPYYYPVYRPWYGYPYHYYGYPVYYRHRYYYPPYRYGWYHGQGYGGKRGYGQPYTPYRFRGADGFLAGYRDRRGATRWVNTVYDPVSPTRDAARRLTQTGDDDGHGRGEPRREVTGAPRLQRRIVEARRAGESGDRLGSRDGRESAQRSRDNDKRRSEPRAGGSQSDRREGEARRAEPRDGGSPSGHREIEARRAGPREVNRGGSDRQDGYRGSRSDSDRGTRPEGRPGWRGGDRGSAPDVGSGRGPERVTSPDAGARGREGGWSNGSSQGRGNSGSPGEGGRRHR